MMAKGKCRRTRSVQQQGVVRYATMPATAGPHGNGCCGSWIGSCLGKGALGSGTVGSLMGLRITAVAVGAAAAGVAVTAVTLMGLTTGMRLGRLANTEVGCDVTGCGCDETMMMGLLAIGAAAGIGL